MLTFGTMSGGVYQSTVAPTSTMQACYCRRCKVTHRRVLPVLLAAAQQQQQQSMRKDLAQEDTQKALQYQLGRSAKQAPAAVQQEHRPEAYEKELVRRQRSAREWITPWLVWLSHMYALQATSWMLIE